MKAKKAKPTGRPTKFTQELADKICYLVETEAKGLNKVCDEYPELPAFRTVFYWLTKHESFLQQYTRAREGQADSIADKMLEIAFKPSKSLIEAQDKKTQLDTLKWIASKLKPKKYGDKLDLTTGGDKMQPVIIDWAGTHGNTADTKAEGSPSHPEQ